MKKGLLILMMLLLLGASALAEEARDITPECTFVRKSAKVDFKPLQDRNYASYYTMNQHRVVEIHAQEDVSGVYLQFFRYTHPLDIQYEQNGEWLPVATTDGAYLTAYVPLPEGAQKVRVINESGKQVTLAEITLFGAGEKPKRIPEWEAPGKADLLLVSTHPDDELLWFGGLLPTYAGEQKKDVVVVCAAFRNYHRRLEMLNGLWTAGVKYHPIFIGLEDYISSNMFEVIDNWGRQRATAKVVTMYRKYQPDVVVLQDIKGEYGHGVHRAFTNICQHAVESAANPNYELQEVLRYGVWEVPKVYIHLYAENQIKMDWKKPLTAFDGKTGLEVATEAFRKHVTQQGRWDVWDGGEWDNSLFGLWHTTVGPDVKGGDMFEHID